MKVAHTMKLKEWLEQRLDETWSAHRLVHMLQDQVLPTSVRLQAETFDPVVLCRFLLSYLHFNTPAQEKQFRVAFRELAERCLHLLETEEQQQQQQQLLQDTQSTNIGDPKWVRVIAALLMRLIPPPVE